MQNVTQFDKNICRELRNELNAVLAKFGSNLEFEVGSMKFSLSSVDIKLTAKIAGQQTFKEQMSDSNLLYEIEALGLVREKNGKRLVRYDSAKYKFPFIYEDTRTGKMFKCSRESVKMQFAA